MLAESPSVFASLLDAERDGCFSIAPALPGASVRQMYRPEINVLCTVWRTQAGCVELIDAMPVGEDGQAGPQLIRSVRCAPRFAYGADAALVTAGPHGARLAGGGLRLRLSATCLIKAEPGAVTATVVLREGEAVAFVLVDDLGADAPLVLAEVEQRIDRTCGWWQRWSARSDYTGRWRG